MHFLYTVESQVKWRCDFTGSLKWRSIVQKLKMYFKTVLWQLSSAGVKFTQQLHHHFLLKHSLKITAHTLEIESMFKECEKEELGFNLLTITPSHAYMLITILWCSNFNNIKYEYKNSHLGQFCYTWSYSRSEINKVNKW